MEYLPGLIGGTITAIWAYYTISMYLLRRKYRHIPGPKSSGILGFYLGNFSEAKKTMLKGKIFEDQVLEWHAKYGPVFKFQIVGTIVVFTSDRSTIKEVLVTKNYPKPLAFMNLMMFPYNERFLGYGLVTDPNEERWRHRRTIFNSGFHRHVLMDFVGQFNSKADILMEKLSKLADGKTAIHLFNEINRATLDAIALIAFGMNIDSVNDENTPFNRTITESLKIIEGNLRDPLGNYNPLKLPTKYRLRKMNNFLRGVGKEKILERIEMFKNQDPNLPDDILTNILKSNKDESLDLEIMIDDFVTFFIAGQETTANTLGFCFLELGKNPEILEKALKEINEVLGDRTEITYQDISKLKYCSCVFKEALRLYPPASNASRLVTDDIDILDYTVPKNTIVMVSSYINARFEKYFPNAYEFNPERFLKDADHVESSVEAYTYFPFSLGPRNCIGQNFAQIEGVVMIAKLLQRFDLKLDPTQSWEIEKSFTLRPIDGARCFLTLRN